MGDGKDDSTRRRSFRIRGAEPTDATAIAHCLEEAFARHRSEYTAGAYADTVLTSDAVLRRLEQMAIFVAVSEGYVIGTVGCTLSGTEGHLRGMAVLQEWQGAGVASDLLKAAEAELVRSGCGVVTLDTTEPLRRAIEFYRRHGYSPSGRVADFFGMRLYEYRKVLH